MKLKEHFYSTKTRYTKLLIDIILLFVLSPIANFFPIFRSLISLLFLIAILFSIDTVSLPARVIFLFRVIAATAFVADIIIFPESPELTALSSVISHICYCLFIMAAISAISTRIINEEQVNQDVIRGGICLYLLLGILWYFFYRIILFFDANAFNIADIANKGSLLFYFSFTTLTTLGYGDVSPVNSFAMMLANAEALIGQLYPAIVIAKLVSLYVEDKD
jgi:hypothetical protein